MRKYLIEMIGAFFLCFVVALTANPIAIGAVLIALVYMGGYMSGGYYNPAITLAVMLQKKLSVKNGIVYMFFQLVGATLAALVFYFMAKTAFLPEAGQQITTQLVVVSELLFSFLLTLVVLHVTIAQKAKENSFYGLAIGLTVMAGSFAVGGISGAIFNPAIGLGAFLVDMTAFTGHLAKLLTYLGSYLLVPFIGGLLASLVYSLTAPVKEKTT